MSKIYGQATEADLSKFEEKFGFTLPADYRAFLVNQNGGRPDLGGFNVPGWGDSILNTLYGVAIGGIHDIERAIGSLDGDFIQEIIPIGNDPGGNQICIGVRGRKEGKVYFWSHENWDTEDEAEVLFQVATSFNEFVVLCNKV